MKHLHFVQSLEPLHGGGLGKAAYELHKQFAIMTNCSFLVTTKGHDFCEDFISVEQYRRIWPKALFFAPKMILKSVSLIKDYDIVHGHGFYVTPNFIFGKLARKNKIPFVYHVHGAFNPWILNRSVLKKKLVHLLFENKNFEYAKLWRALTNKEADQIRSFGIKSPIVVAPNGIHLEEFDSVLAPSANHRKKKRILFLARIHPVKGLDMLVRAWKEMEDLLNDWELIVAGPDENGYQRKLELLIKKCQLVGSVKFVGPVFGRKKVEILKSSDLFILPSYSEGFSVAILEAMACCVPVIATDACNFPEIQTEAGGWVCQATLDGVKSALSEAVMVGDDELVERGRLGRSLVEKKYQWSKIAQDILVACEHHCR